MVATLLSPVYLLAEPFYIYRLLRGGGMRTEQPTVLVHKGPSPGFMRETFHPQAPPSPLYLAWSETSRLINPSPPHRPYLQFSVLLLEILIFIRVALRKLVHLDSKLVDLFPDLHRHGGEDGKQSEGTPINPTEPSRAYFQGDMRRVVGERR